MRANSSVEPRGTLQTRGEGGGETGTTRFKRERGGVTFGSRSTRRENGNQVDH